MSRGTVGAALGAGCATAYLRPDIVWDAFQRASSSGQSLSNRELDRLAQLVEELSRDVARASRTAVTVVRADPHPSGNGIVLYFAGAGVVATLYLVVVRGWRLSDLCYVTQRTFRHGVTSLSSALDGLQTRLIDVKNRLQARIAEVSRKQDEVAAAQAAMRAHLGNVGNDVEAVRGQVGQIHAAVLDMDAALTEVGANQRHALRGIYVLCKAVSELAAGSNIDAKQELLEFTQSTLWQGLLRPAGLESVLNDGGGAAVASGSGAQYAIGGTSAGVGGNGWHTRGLILGGGGGGGGGMHECGFASAGVGRHIDSFERQHYTASASQVPGGRRGFARESRDAAPSELQKPLPGSGRSTSMFGGGVGGSGGDGTLDDGGNYASLSSYGNAHAGADPWRL